VALLQSKHGNGSSNINRINTIGATRDHIAFDHGCFYALHDETLSLPLTADYAPLTVLPEQQKQKTLQALLTILLRIATQQPVLFVIEDLHWVDPTTLELLTLLVDQGPTAILVTVSFTYMRSEADRVLRTSQSLLSCSSQ